MLLAVFMLKLFRQTKLEQVALDVSAPSSARNLG